MGKEFVEYAEGLGEGFKSVSTDTWGMLLEFIETVGEDFEGWSEMDACEFFLHTFSLVLGVGVSEGKMD